MKQRQLADSAGLLPQRLPISSMMRELSASSVPSHRDKSTVLLADGGKLKNWLRMFTFLPERVNYFRDFSDGARIKDMICQILPTLKVNHKMVLPSDNLKVKRKNWAYLYESVFPQIGLRLANNLAEKMLDGKSEIMESILTKLMARLQKVLGPMMNITPKAESQLPPSAIRNMQPSNTDRSPQITASKQPANSLGVLRASSQAAPKLSPVMKLSAFKQSGFDVPGRRRQQESARQDIPDWVTRFAAKIPNPEGYLQKELTKLKKSRPQLDRELYSDEIIFAGKMDGNKDPKARKLLLTELAQRDKTLGELQSALYAVGQQTACLERLLEVQKKKKYLQRHMNDPTFRPMF